MALEAGAIKARRLDAGAHAVESAAVQIITLPPLVASPYYGVGGIAW